MLLLSIVLWTHVFGRQQDVTQLPQRQQLRVDRRGREVSQEALAAKLGMNKSSISRFERHGEPLPNGTTADDYRAALDELAAVA